MAAVFDASSYFTRRQADLRYVRTPLTAATIAALLVDGSGIGLLPASALIPNTITSLEIANEAIGLQQILGNSRPPKVIAATDPQPALPDALFPIGATIMWMADGGRLWINRVIAGVQTWDVLVRTVDLSGKIVASQVAQNIKAILPVTSLPTFAAPSDITNFIALPLVAAQDPISHVWVHYTMGDLVMLTATSKLYTILDNGGGNYVWDPVIRAGADISAGEIAALQLNVDLVQAAIVSAAYIKAANADFGLVTVDQLGVNNATIDNLAAAKIQATLANFTVLNGDTANLNFITAGMVNAGAITTDKLIVGSFDNLMEDGICENPSTAGSWIPDGLGLHLGTGFSHAGIQSLIKTTTTSSTIKNRMVFDVVEGNKVYLEGWAKADSTPGGTLTLRVEFFQDRACIISAGAPVDLIFTAASSTAWHFLSGTGAAPSGARWGRVSVLVSGQTAGTWSADDLYVRKLVASAYIDNLTADHITSGTLDCTGLTVLHLNAGSITAGTIAANLITIDGTNLATGTVPVGKLVSLSVDDLSAGTIHVVGVSSTALTLKTAGSVERTEYSPNGMSGYGYAGAGNTRWNLSQSNNAGYLAINDAAGASMFELNGWGPFGGGGTFTVASTAVMDYNNHFVSSAPSTQIGFLNIHVAGTLMRIPYYL